MIVEPCFALQKAIRRALVASEDVTSRVPARSIIDGTRRPEDFPSIIIGEGQTVNEGLNYSRSLIRVFLDLHVWTKGEALADTKETVAAITAALDEEPIVEGVELVDFLLSGTRFLRDPVGLYGHAIVSIEALVEVLQ
ncbi:DUF3168 domain-containing protein [Fulvimarina sp. 2208YS6-2-32]|uniref:DUF3168 domain-containing protein n=1 Tax=Fulvimarina uroteuthidis TaxID=3098149 RepID=A0ABU5I0R9_9HYPH|nr:DUF3168 domain-containing protein [Fulvimarina sp. 2208YS6-2-32]MDY8107766.1 DUF3168 domain-containing protein [Fulvimarina sp. 2208YS6-2-32]